MDPHLERDSEAIERLWVRGILTNKEREKCHERLVEMAVKVPTHICNPDSTNYSQTRRCKAHGCTINPMAGGA